MRHRLTIIFILMMIVVGRGTPLMGAIRRPRRRAAAPSLPAANLAPNQQTCPPRPQDAHPASQAPQQTTTTARAKASP